MHLLIIGAVAALALALRWMVSAESFWTDELHSAWAASGTWSQVGQRASQGNQQPLFFHLLWLWARASSTGLLSTLPTESLWRGFVILPSVLAAAGMTWSVLRATGSQLGAAAAGLVMALDSNAIFFGTELRPYAWVMFFSLVAVDAASRWYDNRTAAAWWTVHAAAAAAGLMHLTALLSLSAWVMWVTLIDIFRPGDSLQTTDNLSSGGHVGESRRGHRSEEAIAPRRRFHLRRRHGLVTIGWCCLLSWQLNSQQAVWKAKENWDAFGTPTSPADLLTLWPWLSLGLIPAVAMLIAIHLVPRQWRRRRGPMIDSRTAQQPVAWIALGVSILSAVAAYGLAESGLLPIWHRRYLVAGLPMLVWWFGWCIASIANPRHSSAAVHRGGRLSRAVAVVAVAVSCILLLWQQNTLQQLGRGNVRWVRRGEGWREAVAWISQQTTPHERVWVDPGLIEQPPGASELVERPDALYLKYVVNGPYQFPTEIETVAVGRSGSRRWLDLAESGEPPTDWIISRRRIHDLHDGINQQSRDVSKIATPPFRVRRFGGVWVAGASHRRNDTAD